MESVSFRMLNTVEYLLLLCAKLRNIVMTAITSLVLGVGRDVGKQVVSRLIEENHKVFVAGYEEEHRQKRLEAIKGDVFQCEAVLDSNLGMRNAITESFQSEESSSRIDNAIIIPEILNEWKPMDDFKQGDFEKKFAHPLSQTTESIRLLANRMREQERIEVDGIQQRMRQRGTITFVLSHHATIGTQGQFSDNLVQGAYIALMRAAALELAQDEVRVNAIVAVRRLLEDSSSEPTKQLQFRRSATVGEIADAVLYLTSPFSAIINGTVITLGDGPNLVTHSSE